MVLRGSTSNDFSNSFVELFDVEFPVVIVVIKLDHWCKIAYAKAPVHNLHGELSIGSRLATGDAVRIAQLIDQLLTSTNETGSAMAQEHEVISGFLSSKVRVERKQTVDSVFTDAKVFGNKPGCPQRDPSQQMLNILKRTKDEFLCFFVVLWMVVCRQYLAYPVGVNVVDLHFLSQEWVSLRAGDSIGHNVAAYRPVNGVTFI